MEIRNEELGIRNEKIFPLKIAASDFDGTLFREQKISAEDFAAIKAWRAAGNKFGLVTGRAYVMLLPHLREYNLEMDFVLCCNGAAMYDGDGKILHEVELPKKILSAIMNEPFARKSFHFAFEAADKVYCACVKENSWVLREQNRWSFPLEIIEPAQVETLPKKINQIALDFASPDEAQAAAETLNKNFGEIIFAQKNTHSVDVVPAGMNKGAGVAKLLELKNWRGKIFVVGDESNDLPMIKRFGGYTVATAKDFVKREASAVFESVGELLNHFGAVSD